MFVFVQAYHQGWPSLPRRCVACLNQIAHSKESQPSLGSSCPMSATEDDKNQNKLFCANVGEHMVLGSIARSAAVTRITRYRCYANFVWYLSAKLLTTGAHGRIVSVDVRCPTVRGLNQITLWLKTWPALHHQRWPLLPRGWAACGMSKPNITPRTDHLFTLDVLNISLQIDPDLYDLCDLYDLAHVAWRNLYNLHDLGDVSWVGSVPYRSCTTNRLGSLDDLDHDVSDLSDGWSEARKKQPTLCRSFLSLKSRSIISLLLRCLRRIWSGWGFL